MKLLYISLFSLFTLNTFSQASFTSDTNEISQRSSNGFQLLSFDAVLSTNEEIRFTWLSSNQNNIDSYVIECSVDAINYEVVSIVKASNEGQSHADYTTTTKVQKNGMCYFRLKIIDNDGQFSYSRIIALQLSEDSSEITIFPNPSSSSIINLNVLTKDPGKCDLKVMGRTGRIIYSTSIEGGFLEHQFDLEEGYYVLMLTESNGNVITKKIIVN
jgi:hypothetical protein